MPKVIVLFESNHLTVDFADMADAQEFVETWINNRTKSATPAVGVCRNEQGISAVFLTGKVIGMYVSDSPSAQERIAVAVEKSISSGEDWKGDGDA